LKGLEKNEMEGEIVLTPAQRKAAEGVLASFSAAEVVTLRCGPGMGRTTILRYIRAVLRGAFIGAREFMAALTAREPAAIEEAFLHLIETRLATNGLVVVDDLHLITAVVGSCDYPRGNLLNVALHGYPRRMQPEEEDPVRDG
jgi:hypothetical protein